MRQGKPPHNHTRCLMLKPEQVLIKWCDLAKTQHCLAFYSNASSQRYHIWDTVDPQWLALKLAETLCNYGHKQQWQKRRHLLWMRFRIIKFHSAPSINSCSRLTIFRKQHWTCSGITGASCNLCMRCPGSRLCLWNVECELTMHHG